MREKASRISPVGRAVTAPTPDQGDEADVGFDEDEDAASTLPGWPTSVGCRVPGPIAFSSAGGTAAGAAAADPKPAMARLASAGPPLRASSIIPSNSPRIETPRRAASASTQARRSWSRRIPTTVDLEVAMTSLTVIRGVYIDGAEWWQPGGGYQGGDRHRIGRRAATTDRGQPLGISGFLGRRSFNERCRGRRPIRKAGGGGGTELRGRCGGAAVGSVASGPGLTWALTRNPVHAP